MQGNSFDHGSVRMTFYRTQLPTGPGHFKLDPFLITAGTLDAVIKQTIYEVNLFNTENAELTTPITKSTDKQHCEMTDSTRREGIM